MYNVIMKNLQRKRMKSKKCIPNFQPNSYRTSSLMWLLERGEKGINNVDTLPMLVGSQLATSLRIARKPWSNLLVEKRVDGRKMRRTWKKSHAWIRGMVEWYRGVAAQNMVESWSCICMYVYIYTLICGWGELWCWTKGASWSSLWAGCLWSYKVMFWPHRSWHNGSYVLASTLSVFAQHLEGGTGIPLFVLRIMWTPVSKEVLNFSSGQRKS